MVLFFSQSSRFLLACCLWDVFLQLLSPFMYPLALSQMHSFWFSVWASYLMREILNGMSVQLQDLFVVPVLVFFSYLRSQVNCIVKSWLKPVLTTKHLAFRFLGNQIVSSILFEVKMESIGMLLFLTDSQILSRTPSVPGESGNKLSVEISEMWHKTWITNLGDINIFFRWQENVMTLRHSFLVTKRKWKRLAKGEERILEAVNEMLD